MATTKKTFTKLADGMSFRVEEVGEQSDAEICRENGWESGTRLVGDEGYGPTVIEITAIGERSILAKQLSHNGVPNDSPREGSWTLSCRDWKKV